MGFELSLARVSAYAFYGVGNTLSEIAEYNGNKSLHIGIVPRFKLKNELLKIYCNKKIAWQIDSLHLYK